MLFETAKDKFENLLMEYNLSPSLITLTSADLNTLPDSILDSEVNSRYVYGIKDSKILTSAIIHRLNTYCPLLKKDIIYKNLFYAHLDNMPPNTLKLGRAFYFQTYLSKNTIYIYELDNFARVIDSHVIPLNNIISISDIKNHIVIQAKTSHSKVASDFYFVKTEENDKKLFNILSDANISISKIKEIQLQ
ncbi:hypothetical protein [uncultured Clostridium sp.]|jgi:hypothetical protein|uniref:hypothetical protein n=1 Tax=uncultured Clostridium sp. TaxID=59620 RepID=UPI00261EFA57|nr:hypothetical protein [uncultured Clostridium sp.]